MRFWLLIFLLLVGNGFTWWQVWQIQFDSKSVELYFLNVGQGDSQLIKLDNVQILIDGGPNASVLQNLEQIMPPVDRYIDLAIMTHPQLDHFGGLIDVLDRYQIGYFLHNGRPGTTKAYQELEKKLAKQNKLIIAEGDQIKYKDFTISILSPSPANLVSKELNDTSIVTLLEGRDFKALYTGDAGENIEDQIRKKYKIEADVLKVGHHGSRFSSSEKFLKAVRAKVAVIEVGKNFYGHPHPAAISRIKQVGSLIYTTLEKGLIKIALENGQLRILTEK